MSIRILHIADGHGYLPIADGSLDVDMVCVTGDEIADYEGDVVKQIRFVDEMLAPELAKWGCPVFGTPGNHNHAAQTQAGLAAFKRAYEATGGAYLIDEGATIHGLNIYGSPWTLPTDGGSFVGNESTLLPHWRAMPDDTDIALTHAPPFGRLDRAREDVMGFGSTGLRERIGEIQPLIHMFGHAHGGSGLDANPVTVFSNGSIVGPGLRPLGEASLLTINDNRIVDFERIALPVFDAWQKLRDQDRPTLDETPVLKPAPPPESLDR